MHCILGIFNLYKEDIGMCNGENREEAYKRIIDVALDCKLHDVDSMANIQLNTSDIADIINKYLEELISRNVHYMSCSDLAEKLEIFPIDVFETNKQMINYELIDINDLKRYINHQAGDPGTIAVFMSRSSVLNNYRYQVPINLKEALIKYNYDTTDLEETITKYLTKHNIQIDDCIISTVDAMGIVCKPKVDVLKELQSIICTCISTIDDTVCEKATKELQELPKQLLFYTKNLDEEELNKLKEEETFLNSEKYSNIRIMIHNKEYFYKKKDTMYREFYNQYDNAFSQVFSINRNN